MFYDDSVFVHHRYHAKQIAWHALYTTNGGKYGMCSISQHNQIKFHSDQEEFGFFLITIIMTLTSRHPSKSNMLKASITLMHI